MKNNPNNQEIFQKNMSNPKYCPKFWIIFQNIGLFFGLDYHSLSVANDKIGTTRIINSFRNLTFGGYIKYYDKPMNYVSNFLLSFI
ncbi:MAG: hypothetical protein ACI3YJ_02320 [Prevotella sp.]